MCVSMLDIVGACVKATDLLEESSVAGKTMRERRSAKGYHLEWVAPWAVQSKGDWFKLILVLPNGWPMIWVAIPAEADLVAMHWVVGVAMNAFIGQSLEAIGSGGQAPMLALELESLDFSLDCT